MSRCRASLVALLCAVSVLTACADHGDGCRALIGPRAGGGLGHTLVEPVSYASTGRLPDQTLVDWVSYADAVVVATVLSEQAVPLLPGALSPDGSGVQVRRLSMRVDTRVWSRPKARAVPRGFLLESGGWSISNFTERCPMTVGDVRLEVGSAYLLPLAWYPKGPFDAGEHFGLLGTYTPALMGADGRPTSERVLPAQDALVGFIGKSLDDIAAALKATAPDPLAAKYFHLDPVPRWGAVLRARGEPPRQ